MSWLRLDDKFPRHPKVLKLTDAQFRLHLAAMAYCAEHETDGRITREAVETLTPHRGKAKLVARLVELVLWDGDGEDYQIHDYLDWNPSHEQIQSKRSARAEAGSKGGSKSGETRRSKAEANASRLLHPKTNPDPTRPVPSDPEDLSHPRARDGLTRGTLTALWLETTKRSASGNPVAQDDVIRLCSETAAARAEEPQDLALEVFRAGERLFAHWLSTGNRIAPKNWNLEAIAKHFDAIVRSLDAGLPPVAQREQGGRGGSAQPEQTRHTPSIADTESIMRDLEFARENAVPMPDFAKEALSKLFAGKVAP
jgi:hypothetical protein